MLATTKKKFQDFEDVSRQVSTFQKASNDNLAAYLAGFFRQLGRLALGMQFSHGTKFHLRILQKSDIRSIFVHIASVTFLKFGMHKAASTLFLFETFLDHHSCRSRKQKMMFHFCADRIRTRICLPSSCQVLKLVEKKRKYEFSILTLPRVFAKFEIMYFSTHFDNFDGDPKTQLGRDDTIGNSNLAGTWQAKKTRQKMMNFEYLQSRIGCMFQHFASS